MWLKINSLPIFKYLTLERGTVGVIIAVSIFLHRHQARKPKEAIRLVSMRCSVRLRADLGKLGTCLPTLALLLVTIHCTKLENPTFAYLMIGVAKTFTQI